MDAERQQRRKELESESWPLMMQAMWAANVIDIQTTVQAVCRYASRHGGP